MSRSTVQSRMRQRAYQRRKKRRQLRRRRLKILFTVAAVILIVVLGIKGGLKLSRSIKYPVKYNDYIARYSAENHLDTYLVIAVIRQESNFTADARSPYAGGLMQLTEETAAECAQKLGMNQYNYMDPETNIEIGCFFLRTLIDKYGSVDTALAAYNAGMGNVDEWLSNPEYSSNGVTLDYIPYPETRHYVRKINEYMKGYKEKGEF